MNRIMRTKCSDISVILSSFSFIVAQSLLFFNTLKHITNGRVGFSYACAWSSEERGEVGLRKRNERLVVSPAFWKGCVYQVISTA